jgi:hypothetical protein
MGYKIKLCEVNELPLLQEFIDKHWKEKHVMATSKVLMDFGHLNENENVYNFFIAINQESNEVDGILGFIATAHYDQNLRTNGDFWGIIWKVRDDVHNDDVNILGLILWKKLFHMDGLKSYAAVGISLIAKRIYTALKAKTGVLNQFYILKEQNSPYQIAVAPVNQRVTKYAFEKIKKIDLTESCNVKPLYKPYKSVIYLINRYKKHPFYNYEFWMIGDQCVIVTRKVKINQQACMRIVDCLGDLDNLHNLYPEFQAMLHSENAEYVDFMNYGVDENVFLNMGFEKLDPDGKVVIPNYFEPFEQRNVKVEFAVKAPYEDYVIFKGDADQDRPNII